MSWKKKIAIIILLIFIAGLLFVAYEYETTTAEENVMEGDHNVLLLCADPSEKRPGIGAVDMAFIINTHNGNIKNVTPIYPGHMAHPTASPPQYLKDTQGVNKLYLHDSLWSADVENGTKLAQEIVQYNTGLKTDIVVVVTPDAIDAMIQAVGPIYINGTQFNGSSIEFVRNEQYNQHMSRGNAVESVMKSVMNATKDQNKRSALLNAAAVEYAKGNIVVVPKDAFIKIAIANGLQSLI